jgi:hypothetical protein
MLKKTLKLASDERIIAVVPEHCAGPGWANAVIWVHIRDSSGKLRTEDIQPGQRTPEMHALFSVCASAHSSLLTHVSTLVKREKVK